MAIETCSTTTVPLVEVISQVKVGNGLCKSSALVNFYTNKLDLVMQSLAHASKEYTIYYCLNPVINNDLYIVRLNFNIRIFF